MATALITIDQPTHSTTPKGSVGRARNDLELGKAVLCRNTDNTDVTRWRWQLRDRPIGSTAALSDPTASQVTFTPDVEGSYRVTLSINDGVTGQIDTRIAAVPTVAGIRYPAAGEQAGEVNWLVSGSPNPNGWAKDVEKFMRVGDAGEAATSLFVDRLEYQASGESSVNFTIGGAGYPTAVGEIASVDWIDVTGAASGSPPSINGYTFASRVSESGLVTVTLIIVDIDTTSCTDGDYWAFTMITTSGRVLVPITIIIGEQASSNFIYELDWTTLGSQTIAGDGSVSIDGVTWTSVNQANSSTFEIINGTGLVITASSGVSRTWTGGTNTSPALHVQLEDLLPQCSRYDLPISIWSYFSSTTIAESQNAIIAGVYGASANGYSALQSSVVLHNFGASPGATFQINSTFGSPTITYSQATTADVLIWRAQTASVIEMFAGNWDSGWPEFDGSIIQVGHDLSGMGDTTSENDFVRRPDARLIYSPLTKSSSGSPSLTLARTRIVVG